MHRAAISIPELCENIKTKQNEAKALDSKNNNLRRSILDMQLQKADELSFDKEFKDKLKTKGIQSQDILKAAFVKRSGYSIQEVAERFSDFSELENAANLIGSKVNHAGLEHDQLSRENASFQENILKNSQKNSVNLIFLERFPTFTI